MTEPVNNSQNENNGGKTGTEIEFRNITKQYPGQQQPAVGDFNLTIPAGEMVMFVGPSGCGKTTSLKMINRLIEPTKGQILIGGDDVTKRNANELRRSIGYVIQGGSLLPHMTVRDNIAIVPKLLKWNKKRTDERVDELLDMVGLDPKAYRDRYPRELSGGQQQRVGVARGLATDPPVILMDEPFGAVDPITRSRLQDEMLQIQAKLGKTIVCVTHDIDEAIKLGDRIVILREGAKIVQYDTPEQVLANPADEFVADFVGAGSTLKQLTLLRVDDVGVQDVPVCHVGDRTPEVLKKLDEAGKDNVVILDDRDRPVEWLRANQLREDTVAQPNMELQSVVDHRSTLNNALDAMLMSSHGGALVTKGGKFVGVVFYDAVTDYVRSLSNEEAE